MRKKEKSRQVLAHKRGRKWQIDGHHVEYDVLQPSRMMDVLNSAQWAEIFYEGTFQLTVIQTRKYCLHWQQNFLSFGYGRSMETMWNMMSSSQVE